MIYDCEFVIRNVKKMLEKLFLKSDELPTLSSVTVTILSSWRNCCRHGAMNVRWGTLRSKEILKQRRSHLKPWRLQTAAEPRRSRWICRSHSSFLQRFSKLWPPHQSPSCREAKTDICKNRISSQTQITALGGVRPQRNQSSFGSRPFWTWMETPFSH